MDRSKLIVFHWKKYPKKCYKPRSIDILITSGNDLFSLEKIEVEKTSVDATLIFEEIHKEIREYLTEETNIDSTDRVFDLLENLTNRVQKNFDGLIKEDNDKKLFVKALTSIFALLLDTKVDTADKIKRILKIAVETTLEIWRGPN